MDDHWYHGELHGTRGFLPASYVQCLRPLPQTPPQGTALYDFEMKDRDQDCLTFTKVVFTGFYIHHSCAQGGKLGSLFLGGHCHLLSMEFSEGCGKDRLLHGLDISGLRAQGLSCQMGLAAWPISQPDSQH